MRTAVAAIVIVGLMTVPIAAKQKGRRSNAQGIPPGHLPPAGMCRVWYEGRPPGHQPAPTSCREAERVAARDPYARVIYGNGRNDDWNRRDDVRVSQGRPRAIPRQDPSRFPRTYPNTRGAASAYARVAFDNGYIDGLEKGEEDARKNRSYDLQRHSRYRSADRGYDSRYGSKDEYRNMYRDGFQAGYDEEYRYLNGSVRQQNPFGLPWPF